MLNKTLSLLVILGLVATTDFSVFAQSSEAQNSRQSSALFKKEISLIKSERANQLLGRDYLLKAKTDLSSKAMQNADNARQNRKSEGIGKTTAIVIGAVLVAAIVIVLASRGTKERRTNPPCDFPPYCSQP